MTIAHLDQKPALPHQKAWLYSGLMTPTPSQPSSPPKASRLPLVLQGWLDLIGRYAKIIHLTWQHRAQWATPPRLPHELAFLPAHLELMETPVHPAPRWALRILIGALVILLILACWGRLDIVAVARGKLIPTADVKIIQPAVTGVVRTIAVHSGERVQAGQLLLELDPTQAQADADRSHKAKIDAQLTMVRAQALLQALQLHRKPFLPPIPGSEPERQREEQNLADGTYLELQAKLHALQDELHKRQADLVSTQAQILKLQQTLPLAQQQAADYQSLRQKHYVADHDALAKEQEVINQTQELKAQESRAEDLKAYIAEQKADSETTLSTFRHDQLDTLDKAQQQFTQAHDEETKAINRQHLMRLTAPVAGTVQQLNVHTVGGVVTTAQSLMEIVPDDTLEVEAQVRNQDIGFVNPGQKAMIKIETFPYTRYGYLTGKVLTVSNDAVQDKKAGLVFPAKIQLPTRRFKVDNTWVNLTPGMAVTVEIKTGSQSVASYFLSPLEQVGHESLRER